MDEKSHKPNLFEPRRMSTNKKPYPNDLLNALNYLFFVSNNKMNSDIF